jgi:ABC-type cobalamin/Fe3+-siderophores transport system ATPase subunit
MIIGLFLRSYKTYENFNFIPFTDGKDEKFNLLIGNNGAGKSSVLEALDTFFNDRPFIVHSNSKSENASIVPVFLIEKSKISDSAIKDFIGKISTLFWENDLPTNLTANNVSIQNFSRLVDKLKQTIKMENYFIFVIGVSPHSSRDNSLISFQSLFEDRLKEFQPDSFKRNLIASNNAVKSLYNYVYIPVETSITDFLKLEETGMQILMDQNLKNSIEEMLTEQIQVGGMGAVRNTNRKVKMMSLVNEKLEAYVNEVETTIQRIDSTYHFNKETRSKRVNPKDFTSLIIDIYFKTRRLQKSKKEIAHLSAGERKKALIDIAYSFISQGKATEKEIVIAIDEPESSLNISMCYEQFERIEKIANFFQKQVFITTHWYGGLPILNNGRLYHVQKKDRGERGDQMIELEIYALENYFEERGNFPNDINLKSFYDLTSSLVSAIRNTEANWLIVEGNTDKKYIQHYIDPSIELKILPVGGGTIVKKIYEYLYLPISINEETNSFKGSILCLVDTDAISVKLDHFQDDTSNRKLRIRRLQIEKKDNVDKVSLLRLGVGTDTECEIEDVLNPEKFYNAIIELITEMEGEVFLEIKNLIGSYSFNESAIFSKVLAINSIFKLKESGRDYHNDLKLLKEFVDENKEGICKKYINMEIGDKPEWIKEIEKMYTII